MAPIRTLVPSPPARPPRYGLVAALGGEAAISQFVSQNPSDGGPNRWEMGFAFVPDDINDASALYDLCDQDANLAAEALPDEVQFTPFGLWAGVKCSTLTNDIEDLRRRARAKLLVSTSHKLEGEFKLGTWTQAEGNGNWYLNQATDINGAGALALEVGYAALAGELADCLQGSPGFIHVTPQAAVHLVANDLVSVEGGRLVDALGNIVVAGSGYLDGNGPGGVAPGTGNSWAYGTGAVQVRLSEISLFEYRDPINNEDRVIATRTGAVYTDELCGVAVRLDHA